MEVAGEIYRYVEILYLKNPMTSQRLQYNIRASMEFIVSVSLIYDIIWFRLTYQNIRKSFKLIIIEFDKAVTR